MPDITYAEALAPLESLLAQVERPGNYFATGAVETPMPLFEVDGVGLVSFPVPPDQCQRLITASAERAPYGRGDETLIDESVRKVWQIPTDKVQIGGKHWDRALSTILEQATAGLGCPANALDAEFYKMLVYDKGGFFLPHRDTEKAPGMVATLVVVLPSAHSGGDLVVRHNDRETVLDLSELDPAEIRFAAFYADCEHEVRPITQGHRVCLVYNLIQTSEASKAALQTPDTRLLVESAAAQLIAWAENDQRADKLVYLLEHHYTEAALSFDGLKGRDAAVADILEPAAEKSDCALHLGLVHIEESGWAEYDGYQGSYRGRRYWDDDDDEDGFEIGEVCDQDRYIDQWRDQQDQPTEFGKIPLNEEEILPVGALDDEDADETHFSEATGNAGASFERTYLRAALILWPQSSFDTICASAGTDAALARLGTRVREAETATNKKLITEAKEAVVNLAEHISGSWPPYDPNRLRFHLFLQSLIQFGDVRLLRENCLPLLDIEYDGSQNPQLLAWADLVGYEEFSKVLEMLFDPEAEQHPAGCVDLWCALATHWQGDDKARASLLSTLDPLLDKLATFGSEDSRTRYHRYGHDDSLPKPTEWSPQLLTCLLERVAQAPTPGRLPTLLKIAQKNTTFFKVDQIVLPALERVHQEQVSLPSAVADQLWKHCAVYYLERAATPPSAPENWTQVLSEEQLMGLRDDIKKFVLDPKAKEIRFRLRQDLRQEICQIIISRRLDINHVTDEKGRPYTLVCTKTLGYYERACRQYERDFDDMRRLLTLPGTEAAQNRLEADRLRSAVALGEPWQAVPENELNLPAPTEP